jgi:hypothetical protein
MMTRRVLRGAIGLASLALVFVGLAAPRECGVCILGMFGLVVSLEAARFNVVNLQPPPDPEAPVCEVTVEFLDSAGERAAPPGRLALGPGQAGFVDFLGGPDTRPGERVQVRARATAVPERCNDLLLATLEVFDTATGKTSFVLAGPAFR